ncbi:MAG: ABC transporter permease [Actinomycetota bacterium]
MNKRPNTNLSRGSGGFSSIFKSQPVFLIIIMILIGVIVTIINPKFLSVRNLFNIVLGVSSIGIVCVGMGTVLITGNFDLTLGPLISILGIVMAIMLNRFGPAVTVIAVIALGVAIGAFNGILVTRVKAHSFIVTLALSTVYEGVALLLAGGTYISLGGKFRIFSERLWDVVPTPTVVLVAVIIGAYVVYRYTKFGRLLFAIGGNEKAAYLAGVKVRLYKVLAFSLAGGMYAIASLVLISQLGVVYPSTGFPYTLPALAAIVVGGIALQGGKGSALGIFLGAVMFGLISNALVLTGVDPFWRDVAAGFLILLAVGVSGMVEDR